MLSAKSHQETSRRRRQALQHHSPSSKAIGPSATANRLDEVDLIGITDDRQQTAVTNPRTDRDRQTRPELISTAQPGPHSRKLKLKLIDDSPHRLCRHVSVQHTSRQRAK